VNPCVSGDFFWPFAKHFNSLCVLDSNTIIVRYSMFFQMTHFHSRSIVSRRWFFLFVMLCSSLLAVAQKQTVLVSGTVKGSNGKPLEAATVSVYTLVKNETKTDTFFAVGISNKLGEFTVKAVASEAMQIEISLIGFTTVLEPIVWLTGSGQLKAGSYTLTEASNQLGNVVVTAKKPFMQLGVDRRIFNAEASIVSKGGTAVDLMRTIPGLNVDVNGNVQLRNSSPQIFVDGRPTILTLEQIPSDDIEKVEVITNPSAKYDAGSTGGIINVVLKKSRRNGMNGTASIGGGVPKVFNSNVSINYRQGKLNFFASGSYNRSGGTAISKADRTNKQNGQASSYFNQRTESDRSRRFTSGRFGLDYFMDDMNSISVSQGFVDGRFGFEEIQDQNYYDANRQLTQTGIRYNNDYFGFKRQNTQVNYRRTFAKEGKEWTADFTYNGGTNGGANDISNQLYFADGNANGAAVLVRNEGVGNGRQYTFQTDYVNPISENSKLELGARSYHNISNDKLDVFSVANSGNTKLPLSNNYGFKEMINAVYGNYSNALGKRWKYQAGLRFEYSKFDGELKDSAQKFGYTYPNKSSGIWNAFFPSLYLTYQLKEGHDLQINFSRRIRRPNFWQINPYTDISDPQNIRKGNPALRPEFTNSFEVNYNRVYEKGNFLISAYYRNNTEDITQYTDTISADLLSQLGSAGITPTALVSTFINADRTNRSGLELTWQHKFTPAFDISPNLNFQYRDVKAIVNNLNLSNYGFNWNARLTMNYKIVKPESKLLNNISFQLMGEYESPRVIPQGRMKAQQSMDFAIRKDFLKNNAGTLTFNVQDVFNSRIMGTITDTDRFYQDSFRRWNVRTIRLTFSYRFGNKDLQIFKRKEGGDGEGREG